MCFAFLLMILLFNMAPKFMTEVLSCIPNRAEMYLMEKIFALDKLCFYAVMSDSVIDHKFNVNKSTIYII